MQRYVETEYRGRKITMLFTMSALLDIEEEYDAPITEALEVQGSERLRRVCWMISALSYAAAGSLPGRGITPISPEEMYGMLPWEYQTLTEALFEAFTRGYKREIEPDEVDEGLLELKKKSNGKRRRFWRWGKGSD